MIVSGELHPGDRLPREPDLDAATLLEPFAFVMDLHRTDSVLHFFHVRRLLEPEVAAIAGVDGARRHRRSRLPVTGRTGAAPGSTTRPDRRARRVRSPSPFRILIAPDELVR